MKPDLEMSAAFLRVLDENPVFTFQTFGEAGKENPSLRRVLHGTLAKHAEELIGLQRRGAGVFVMVNKGDGIIHEGDRSCRNAKNVLSIRAVFIDLDGAPLEPILKLEKSPMIVQSSPGRWHAYWPVIGLPLDRFKPMQQKLASAFGGDEKVCDLPRVMRLPGFWHLKKEPFMTRVVVT